MARAILVTGASSGIGRATVLELVRRGATVYAGVRDPAAAEGVGPAVTPIQLDVTDAGQVAAVGARLERLDGLVNNAGIAITGPLEHLPLDAVRHQLEVNALGQLAVIQACLPALRAAQGRIVNMSSISGRVAFPMYGPYAASKFALEAFGDSLRRELRGSGVDVVAIEPGSVATPIWERGLGAGDRLWAAMPEVAHRHYGKLYDTMRATGERLAREGDPPEALARLVADVLEARRPRARYVFGRSARIQTVLARVLPDRAFDALIAAALRRQS
jgi:NAD(P)-dependent dehydrogenase (short-subunit alcohol dehydrogenase family)